MTTIGIDLGTTNSLCGHFTDDGETQLIPNVFGEYLTPSVIGLSDKGEVLVGRAASDRLVTHPNITIAAFKRSMGSDRVFELGRESFRAEELSAILLRRLVDDALEFLGEPVEGVVISVPAYFNEMQRRATRLAGELAGLRVERLVNEPTAAALAYGLHEADADSTFLVFDLGGGTFDVSVLELFDGVMEVHASAGDNFLGGEDFVREMVRTFVREHGLELEPNELGLLHAQAESAKRALNTEKSVVLRLERGGETFESPFSQARFEELAAPLLDRMRTPVERALRDASFRLDDLDEVVLVGGATRMKLVQQLVARLFGKLPLRRINPDEVVARGAAVQAALVARHEALDDVVMTDVCPFTLGVEIAREVAPNQWIGGVFSPIIERNTIIPASRVQSYSPVHDSMRSVHLTIYQGESLRVENNVRLGEIEVKLPRSKGDDPGIDVRFSYDPSGLLHVETTVRETQRTQELIITQNESSMSKRDIGKAMKRLESLKVHPRDQDENRAALNRAHRLYEEYVGSARSVIQMQIEQFEAALASQDPITIRQARKTLEEFLDHL